MGACMSKENSDGKEEAAVENVNQETKQEEVEEKKHTKNVEITANPFNLVIYGAGVFETKKQTIGAGIKLANSGFSTIILWTIHVHDNCDLYYNNHLIVSNGKLNEELYGPNGSSCDIKSEISTMAESSNGSIKNILFGIGSADVPDFKTCATIQQNGKFQDLMTNFAVLLSLGADGFDYDCEEWGGGYDETLVNIITDMAIGLKGVNAQIQTFVPYNALLSWLEILVKIFKNNKTQLIAWWNLQCYSGGFGNNPKDWIDSIRKQQESNGVTNPSQYIVPGLDGQQSLSDITSYFKGYSSTVDGGFIWNFPSETSAHSLQEYSHAIANGLKGE